MKLSVSIYYIVVVIVAGLSIQVLSLSLLKPDVKPKPLQLNYGSEVHLTQENLPIDEKLKTADLCQIEMLDMEPLSAFVGFLEPKTFPCFFSEGTVKYKHEGSQLRDFDEIYVRIFFFRQKYSATDRVKIKVHLAKQSNWTSRVTVKSDLFVSSWKGVSQSLNADLIHIKFDPRTEYCELEHKNVAGTNPIPHPWIVTRMWPLTGLLITFNKTKIYSFRYECQKALLMGYRFMNRKPNSPPTDFLPLTIRIRSLTNNFDIIHEERLHIPIHINIQTKISGKLSFLPPPQVKNFRTIKLLNVGGSLSFLPKDALAVGTNDNNRGPLIVALLKIDGPIMAKLINSRQPAENVFSFTFNDLTQGLISFCLEDYSSYKELEFRLDFQIMDPFFIKSEIIIMKLITIYEAEVAPFRIFTRPFLVYTGQQRALRTNNIQVVGPGNKSLIKLRLTNYTESIGSFYKYASELLTPTSVFKLADIQNDQVGYVHNAGLMHSDSVEVEVSLDPSQKVRIKMPIRIIRVFGKSKLQPIRLYTQYSLMKSTYVNLYKYGLMSPIYLFYLNRDKSDVTFRIKKNVKFGQIIKRLTGYNKKVVLKVGDRIKLSEIVAGIVYYDNIYKLNSDFYQDDVLKLRRQTKYVDKRTIKLVFKLKRYVKKYLIKRTENMDQFTCQETNNYCAITNKYLTHVNYFIKPTDIQYTIVQFPVFTTRNGTEDAGRLVSLQSLQHDVLKGDTTLTRNIENLKQSFVTSVVTFSKQQVNDRDIVYVTPPNDIGASNREVIFKYSVRDSNGHEMTNDQFNILVLAVDNKTPNVESRVITLSRDEDVILNPLNIRISDEDTEFTQLTLVIVTLPQYGSIMDGKEVVKRGNYSLKANRLAGDFIKYKHDGRNVQKDSFKILVHDNVNYSPITTILFNITKRILDMSMRNFYINNTIMVRENSSVVLQIAVFKKSLASTINLNKNDNDINNNPMFIIVANPTLGDLIIRNSPVTTFNYQNVARGQVWYKHRNSEIGYKPKSDFAQIWVLDTGQSFNINFTIEPVNSQRPKLLMQLPLQIVEGGETHLSFSSLSVQDPDSKRSDLIIEITVAPHWGEILNRRNNRNKITSFKVKDMESGDIIYKNTISTNGIEQSSDKFIARAFDGKYYSDPVEIPLIIQSRTDEPPKIILQNFNVALGEDKELDSRILQISDSDIPRDILRVSVKTDPLYGSITLKYNIGETQIITSSNPPFDLRILNIDKLLYVQNKKSLQESNITFPVKDRVELFVTDGVYQTAASCIVNITGPNKFGPKVITNLIELKKTNQKVITADELSALDPDTLPIDINYKIIKLPSRGQLYLNQTKLVLYSTFTQEDINSNCTKYVYTGKNGFYIKDSFLVEASDGRFISEAAKMLIFITEPIQKKKMILNFKNLEIRIGKVHVIKKSDMTIRHLDQKILNSLSITLPTTPVCGSFYYWFKKKRIIQKFTFNDIVNRKVVFSVKDCPEVVTKLKIPVTLFSHLNYDLKSEINIKLLPKLNTPPHLTLNKMITTIDESDVQLTNNILVATDEDNGSDELIYSAITDNSDNSSWYRILVNNVFWNQFSQLDINSNRVVIRLLSMNNETILPTKREIKLRLSDGMNDEFIYQSKFLTEFSLNLSIKSWKKSDFSLLKYSIPKQLVYVDTKFGFLWSWKNILTTKLNAEIQIKSNLKAGYFFNTKTRRKITTFRQEDINRMRIYYLLYKSIQVNSTWETVLFKLKYDSMEISTEKLNLTWPVLNFDRNAMLLCRQSGVLTLTAIRSGNIDYESFVSVNFEVEDEMMIQNFRIVSQQRLHFKKSDTKKQVVIKVSEVRNLKNDSTIIVKLTSPKSCVFGLNYSVSIGFANDRRCDKSGYYYYYRTGRMMRRNLIATGDKWMLRDQSDNYLYSDSNLKNIYLPIEFQNQFRSDLMAKKKIFCAPGWSLHKRRCYKGSKQKLSWTKAVKVCQSEKSYLTVVDNMEDMQWLRKLFNNRKPFWIGLHRIAANRKWQYVTKEAVLFQAWDTGFPKKSGWRNRDCVLVTRRGVWRNRPCLKKKALFVCMANPLF